MLLILFRIRRKYQNRCGIFSHRQNYHAADNEFNKTKNLNDFNMLQIFFVASVFGTVPALYMTEHDINRRFTGGSDGSRE